MKGDPNSRVRTRFDEPQTLNPTPQPPPKPCTLNPTSETLRANLFTRSNCGKSRVTTHTPNARGLVTYTPNARGLITFGLRTSWFKMKGYFFEIRGHFCKNKWFLIFDQELRRKVERDPQRRGRAPFDEPPAAKALPTRNQVISPKAMMLSHTMY